MMRRGGTRHPGSAIGTSPTTVSSEFGVPLSPGSTSRTGGVTGMATRLRFIPDCLLTLSTQSLGLA
jgi:hypothetical protein